MEKKIIEATKEFAASHNIHYDELTESMILNAMRELKQILQPTKLYTFLYNSDIHDSSYSTISVHYTKEGAEEALNLDKEKEYIKWLKYSNELQKRYPEIFKENPFVFGEHEDWAIGEMDIQP